MIEIYLVARIEDSKSYIGMTSTRNYGNGILIKKAKRKHGADAFCTTILARTEDKEKACELERFYISLFKTLSPAGFNIALGGQGNQSMTEEMKRKMSLKLKGRPSPNKGRTASSETRQRISAGLYRSGFKHSDEHKARMSELFKGRVMSEDTRKKMSEAAKRRASTPEGLARLKLASMKSLEKRT